MYIYIHIILHGSRDLLRPYCNLGVFFVGFKHIPRHLEHKGYKNPKNTGVLLEQTKKGGHRCGYYNNILAAYIKKKHLHVLLKFIANDSW